MNVDIYIQREIDVRFIYAQGIFMCRMYACRIYIYIYIYICAGYVRLYIYVFNMHMYIYIIYVGRMIEVVSAG